MSIEVVIPWRGECAHRERALRWLRERLSWPVVIAPAQPGVWSKGAALLPVAARSSADLLVIHDADVWSDGLPEAIGAVEGGEPWAMPHETVYRLSEPATANLLDGNPDPWNSDVVRPPYRGWWGGGIVVIPRSTYLSCPMDPRFLEWGGEDLSWANALWFLAGEGWRGSAALIHLYHPQHPYSLRATGNPESRALARRYRQARFRPAEMRALVNEIFEEADVASHAAQQAVRPGAAV